MSRSSKPASHRKVAIAVGTTTLAAVMWYAAAIQMTGGLVDVAVFAPPAVALGLTAVWSAHAFMPHRFTWRRGLIGALVGGFVAGPLTALFVAFAAAWNPASFHFLFTAGAWVALAAGLGVGGAAWTVREIRKRLRERRVTRRITRRARFNPHQSKEPRRCLHIESPW